MPVTNWAGPLLHSPLHCTARSIGQRSAKHSRSPQHSAETKLSLTAVPHNSAVPHHRAVPQSLSKSPFAAVAILLPPAYHHLPPASSPLFNFVQVVFFVFSPSLVGSSLAKTITLEDFVKLYMFLSLHTFTLGHHRCLDLVFWWVNW
ncbi:hypothetical protein Ancab_003698 [Ancistrocladus abbreviatus]